MSSWKSLRSRVLVPVLVLIMALPGVVSVASAQEGDSVASMSQLLQRLRTDSAAAEARDRQRLSELLDDREALRKAVKEAETSLAAARQRRDQLEATQKRQRQALAEINQRRRSEVGDLGGVFKVVQRHIGELRDALGGGWLTVGTRTTLPERLDDNAVIDTQTLQNLGQTYAALTAETGRGVRFEAPIAAPSGNVEQREAIRLGDFLAFSNGRLLTHDTDSGANETGLRMVAHTPEHAREALRAFQQGEGRRVVFDPTQGDVLSALAQQPSLWERFQQGGSVGYVIVVLGIAGLLVALAQYAYLLVISWRIRRQLRTPETLSSHNPLGRVLGRFAALGHDHAPEALEARLDEALLAEKPRLERGQPLVKLMAAVAPLLGLLGTVTGMIGTFQSITVFGTGDPQLMAGGISQALVTTVLGLIVAVPLLFVHTALSSRSRELLGTLEGRASAVLAEHLEATHGDTGTQAHAHAR
ncbi:outer membrane transport energization protein ExbB [Chromohalobacter marismortui]|uniref:Outer membrane transport energization protein ExbB n=1 Tax=Chromohalobacter marismortui TaxID=42055 RepID=A0A4V3F4F0_9GAMM|nr:MULTISPECIES: MotA/TolQ/ExbB proton channel family protein [Chromohalobacter]MCI0510358.1 MotA/TolQ/ExbB proton channel family protein [Chromohalobacter sp.]MCI0594757.1 MotA/TolQ/ExbB proton channel family protein [Chromohalobacter sp.]TDU25066.1 outer membrane transport energization protein ExbB [Chromohalobacter marismortui]